MGQVQNHTASWKTSWLFYLRNSCISDINLISILSHCPEMSEIILFHRLSRLPGNYVYFLSHRESIFSLHNYCQSWIRTCQSCRKESNSFLQSKYELALLVFVFLLSVKTLHEWTQWRHGTSEIFGQILNWYTIGFRKAVLSYILKMHHCESEKLSWRLFTSYECNRSHHLSHFEDFSYWVRGQTIVWDWAQAINSSLSFMTESCTGLPQGTCNNAGQRKQQSFN